MNSPSTLSVISRQIAQLQSTMQVLIAEATAPPAGLEMDDGRELSDEDLFVILHCKGLGEYKKALRRRNKQRTERLRRYGRL